MTNTTTATFPAYANYLGWSDVDPYEVVRVISDKCIEIREMSATLAADWSPERIPGGFAGHCINNNSQRWNIVSNPNGEVVRIRLHKDGRWYGSNKQRFQLSETPRKKYDYNF